MIHSRTLIENYRKILLLRINHSYAGFFAYATFVLNQLRYCEAANYFPVVYFGPHSGDGPNAFYDSRYGDNSWEYYFEPVAGLSYAELCRRIHDPADPLSVQHVVQLSSEYLWNLHAYDPASIYTYPYGYYRTHPPADLNDWYRRQRATARSFIAKYIRPKPHIFAKALHFWKTHLEGFQVIGVHMRGSDKGAADADPALARIIPPREYFPHIDQFLKTVVRGRIFLATDQLQFVRETRARYGERVVVREVSRSSSFGPLSNPFQNRTVDGYTKGEEVLIDCLLLAMSQRLLKCTSAVGEFATYFNGNATVLDVNWPEATGSKRDHKNLEPVPPSSTPTERTAQKADDTRPNVEVPAKPSESTIEVARVLNGDSAKEWIGPGKLFEGAVLINLDCRPDRLERSLMELRRHGLGDCVVRLSAYRHWNGMYGCSVSHLQAVQLARSRGWRSVLIFEDDIKFSEKFGQDAPPALHDLSERKWGLFQLGAMLEPQHLEVVTPNLIRFKHGHAAHAFAVHESTFPLLMHDYVCELNRGNWEYPKHLPFDEYLNNWLPGAHAAYASKKLLVSQYPGMSDTWNQPVNYTTLVEDVYARLNAGRA